ncbi:GntR family transcriptional regulator [Profundibacterium mesophilum]|uniref:Transcriptional regulator GntR family protein n=1 Tax=Profundibacterium mesophilum KAUST100406-0324 TaxID=1037889 RepID=A0A921TD85_9RHOB|nr:GntR family transcriptional regulator [Profundibacterium mesophilum]KAF0676051.1 Transcriptional regulator GntR family protein [Profundibacterium mesophilum KAUST100406-0324]
MTGNESGYHEIADTIRERICLAPIDDPFVLREPVLAEEFGISRTPIRQILQRLAFDKMVETRPGIGTIAKRLDPKRRAHAFAVYNQLASAAAACSEGDPLPDWIKVELIGLANLVIEQSEHTPESYIRYSKQIVSAMALSADDDILSSALTAAHWRVLRWRVQDMRATPEFSWQGFKDNMERIAKAVSTSDRAVFLRTVAGVVERQMLSTAAE